jgi:large subunit ribosomal protein L29
MAIGTKTVELRKIADDELGSRLVELKEELFNLRFQSATGQLESHGRLRAVRRDIARIYTVLRERELGITEIEGEQADMGATDDSEKQEKGGSE